jgi:hypothetical protein
MCVVSGGFVVTSLMMAGRFAMVFCGLLVVLRCPEVMLRCLF